MVKKIYLNKFTLVFLIKKIIFILKKLTNNQNLLKKKSYLKREVNFILKSRLV